MILFHNKNIERCLLLFILACSIVACCSWHNLYYSFAGVQEVIHYRLSTGVIFVWKNSAGIWQNGFSPGSTQTIIYNHNIGVGMKDVMVYKYNPNAVNGSQGYFDFQNNNFYHWNKGAAIDYDSYNKSYYDYASTPLTTSIAGDYDSETGKLVLSCTATLRTVSGINYDVKEQLSYGAEGKIKLFELLGSPSEDLVEAMNLMDPASEQYNPNVEGYLYFVPIIIQYTVTTEVPDEPIIPTGEDIPESEEPIVPKIMEGEAILDLPKKTYEGHTVEAMDMSQFTVDGVNYSARRLYEEGLASNSFSVPKSTAGSAVKTSLTSADITFDNAGTYPVTLKINSGAGAEFSSSSRLSDSKSIEVMKTPAILGNLAGVQKKNRKQILNITVATNPMYPLTELWVELEKSDGTEKVRLDHTYADAGFKDTLNVNVNSDMIKTRAIDQTEADECFTTVQLLFLTKNEMQEEYTYRIHARDTRGQEATAEVDFIVAPDLPPQAKIETEASYLRNKGTNVAAVIAEDCSVCDGDQVIRQWSAIPMDGDRSPSEGSGGWNPMNLLAGYRDLSFGSGKKVSFDKTGVGPVLFKLEVQDFWVEETLPEYITEEDYLKAETQTATEVVNIAPTISMEPIFSREVNVLLLASGKPVMSELIAGQNILREKLIEKGIDANITIEKIPASTTDESIRGYYYGATASLPFGYNGVNTFLERKWFSIDEENLYTINGTWISGTHDDYPEMPYVISSVHAEDNSCNWTYTINRDVLDMAPGDAESFTHDDSGRYLYFRYGGKTLVLAKDTGAYLATIDMILGDFNFIGGNDLGSGSFIYTVKSDGIYAISAENGTIKRLYDGQIRGQARRVEGKIHFLAQTGPATISRAKMDPVSGDIEFSRIRNTTGDAPYTTYNCIGIDSEGKLIIGLNNQKSVRVYDSNNQLIRELNGWNTERTYSVTPAYDEKGRCNYITSSWEIKGSTKYYSYAGIWGVHDNTAYSCSMYSTNGFRTNAGYPMFAMQTGDKVHIQTGANWAGLYGGGSVMSYYNEYAYLCTFDLASGSGAFHSTGDFAFGAAGEYGRTSDQMIAASYTFNGDSADVGPDNCMNGLRAKTMIRHNSLNEVISRFLNKHAKDSTIIEGTLNNANFFYVDETDMDAGIYDRLAAGIANEDQLVESVMALKKGEALEDICATKEYILEPDRTYYYEYDAKGVKGSGQPLSWRYITHKQVAEEQLDNGAYYVTHTELEDFNDNDTNTFFQIPAGVIAEGIFKAADLNKGDTKLPNRIFTDGCTLSFEVPSGKMALLSFDYDIKSKGWTPSEIFVNEERWHRLTGAAGGKGHYTAPRFLPEGLNSIRFQTMDYGTLPLASYVYIDNLKVIYVENDPAILLSSTSGDRDFRSEDAGGGWTRYSGNFDTPSEVMTYRAYPGEYIQSDFIASTSEMVSKNSEKPDNKILLIDVPEGKAALDAGLLIESYPTATSSNSYNVLWKWTEKAYTWTCYAKAENGTLPLQIPRLWRLSLGTLIGQNHFTESARSAYGAWGDFRKADFYLANSVPQPVTEGKYFYDFDLSGNPETLYVENESYTDKTAFSFSDSSDELWFVRDLKVYSIENGIKVYAEEKNIVSDDFVSKWEISNGTAMAVKLKGIPEEPDDVMVYKKGQLIAYNVFYSDYEQDPSRRGFWRYLHMPLNDGAHPLAAAVLDEGGAVIEMTEQILDQPIERFYIDGKYIVEHWQEDNTARTEMPKDGSGHPRGYPDYDKLSNVETFTFYVIGTATAPWIKEIKTMTLKSGKWSDFAVNYRDTFRLKIKVDDKEKDTLSLHTEVYLDRRLIYTYYQSGIDADFSGNYPSVLTGALPDPAEKGTYQVICTVRDETGAGVGVHRFVVERVVPKIRIHRLF